MFVLSEEEVGHAVGLIGIDAFMDRLIAEIDRGFRSISENGIEHSTRRGFVRDNNLIEWMPVINGPADFTVKIVGYHPNNPIEHNASTINAVVVQFDLVRGAPKSIVGANLLTAMRTGAASAVASRYLAVHDARALGLVGCGAQAVTQAHAISRLFAIEEILFHDVDPEAVASAAARLAFLGIPAKVAPLDRIEERCDIICTATTTPLGAAPVLPGAALKKAVHINAVGSDFPGKTELPRELVWSSVVVADSLAQARQEGECQLLTEDRRNSRTCLELADLIRDAEHHPHVRNGRTIFDSTGIALEDAIAADLVCELARAAGLGRELPVSGGGHDPRDPYAALRGALPDSGCGAVGGPPTWPAPAG